MGAVYFYHLTETPLEKTLPMLLAKARAAGWRIVVRGAEAGRLNWLDDVLWQGPGEAFLPHGRDGGEYDALQPVLLTLGTTMANGASCLMVVDGAEVSADEVAPLDRTCIIFNGNDPQAVDRARGQWKSLTGAGCSAQYWSQDAGRWAMKAEA